ncbi:MAG: YajQ family cyclic di-GMP-binding protein [Planctomycetota bacterium]|nr:YajQ family cyclic di-GMP-binding protein [Planctomycetota bacterium]
MPSFDIVSRFNFPELDNAVNNAKKAVAARFDFRESHVEISVDQKEKLIKLVTDDPTKMRNLVEMFESAANRRGLDLKSFDWSEPEPTLAGRTKCQAKIRDGIEQEKAKQIVRIIKDAKLKVQASIQGEELRVTGKQIDDLQATIKLLNASGLGIPLQFVNMKS